MAKRKAYKSKGRVDALLEPLDWEKFTNEKLAKRLSEVNRLPNASPTNIPFCPLDPEEKHTAPRDPLLNFAAWKTS